MNFFAEAMSERKVPGAEPGNECAVRCRWVNPENPLYVKYHDEEWGRPVRDDAGLYEMLVLESFVAGLSWECVLNKRAAFRTAFAGFCPEKVAAFGETEVISLMATPGIIRHRGKISATITNTRVFLQIQQEFGSFGAYVRRFTGNEPLLEPCTRRASSPLSDAISRDLRRRGMRYMGSVTVYSWLQATGFIQAHEPECFMAQGPAHGSV